MKFFLASCLLGNVQDCEFLINWGEGGAGKSTLLNLLLFCFYPGIYAYSGNAQMFKSEQEFKMAVRGNSVTLYCV